MATAMATSIAQHLTSRKLILAPMVRIGTLPNRLLCLRYGADLVYSEELIDFKLEKCERVVNRALGTIDFICNKGSLVFRTCEEEKERVILQMGTCSGERALRAGKLVENDVAGIDVNMGCPKSFSIDGGMGAALLKEPEKVREILTSLVKGLSVPVSCKIRILPSIDETLHLVKVIESCGVSCIAVHGRYQSERSAQPVHIDEIRRIVEVSSVPIIANGGSNDIKCFDDIATFAKATGCSSVMLARCAQWNPSVFRKEGLLPEEEVVKEYLKLAIDYDNKGANTKYCIAQMMHKKMTTDKGRRIASCRSVYELCDIWGLSSYYQEVFEKRSKVIADREHMSLADLPSAKKMKLEPEITEDGTYELYMMYDRRQYSPNETPRSVLCKWAKSSAIDLPLYNTIERSKDRRFKSTVTVKNMKFSSSHWEKSKKFSEQAAAMVAVDVLL